MSKIINGVASEYEIPTSRCKTLEDLVDNYETRLKYHNYEFDELSYKLLIIDLKKILQENQQLREKYNIRSKAYNEVLLENASLKEENSQLKQDYELYKDNFIYRNYEVEIRDNTIKQLKEVIEEVREVITDLYNIIYNSEYEKFGLSREQYRDRFKKLLQILDKAKTGDKQ